MSCFIESLISEIEASRILGIKQRTLQQWRVRGYGPEFVRIGQRLIRYKRSDVNLWVDTEYLKRRQISQA